MDRNIEVMSGKDKRLTKWRELILNSPVDGDNNMADEQWERDVLKCSTSHEAVVQRTVMMNLLDRHNLDEILDYNCEAEWFSDREKTMPTGNHRMMLSRPKPDLAVAFKTESLLAPTRRTIELNRLPGLYGRICPDGKTESTRVRALPFLVVEAKGIRASIDNREAQLQNLNTASAALHNLYLIMREAGRLEKYFDEVKFFSATMTYREIEIRVHYPARIKNSLLQKDYEAAFRFDTIVKYETEKFTRTNVNTAIYNILVRYGINVLFPIMKEAIEILFVKYDLTASSSQTSVSSTTRQTHSNRKRKEMGTAESEKSEESEDSEDSEDATLAPLASFHTDITNIPNGNKNRKRYKKGAPV
jgi:hypothetical protein